MPESWNATLVFGGLWLAVAGLNAYYRSDAYIRKNRRDASSIPFIGGIFALLAFRACPSQSPLVWVALLVALILDRGSLPYVVLFVMSLAWPDRLAAINQRREEKVRRIVGATRAAPVKGTTRNPK
jgi:hypothetical protein